MLSCFPKLVIGPMINMMCICFMQNDLLHSLSLTHKLKKAKALARVAGIQFIVTYTIKNFLSKLVLTYGTPWFSMTPSGNGQMYNQNALTELTKELLLQYSLKLASETTGKA